MEFSYRELLEFAWKLNSGRCNPLATTAVVQFVMLIRTILIPNLDCFDGERNALYFNNRIGCELSFSDSLNHMDLEFYFAWNFKCCIQ